MHRADQQPYRRVRGENPSEDAEKVFPQQRYSGRFEKKVFLELRDANDRAVIGGFPGEFREEPLLKSVNGKTYSDQAEMSDRTGFDSSLPPPFIGRCPQLPKRFWSFTKAKRSCEAHVMSSALLQALASFDPLDSRHPNSSCSFKRPRKNLFGTSGYVG